MTEAEATPTHALSTIRPAPRPGALLARWRAMVSHLGMFAAVGGVAFVVDLAVYNVLRATVLDDSPIWAKVGSTAVSMAVAWIGNRRFTFRGRSSGGVAREALLFALMNVCGLVIASACLYISHYLLGFTSQWADNVSGNVIGLVLATAFRYGAYRYVVFR
jgi:putative flippase GtrA